MGEVEENNDAARIRRTRLLRGIRKMRLERAILLESLAKRMRKNGAGGVTGMYDEDSENSSDNPPTVRPEPSPSALYSSLKPQERPLRNKKSHRRTMNTPPPSGLAQQQSLPSASSLPPPSSNRNPSLALTPEHGLPETELMFSPPTPRAARPPPPMELFIQHMISQMSPGMRTRDFGDFKREDLEVHYEQAWPTLSEKERLDWHRLYEERMAQYTRAEDQRKKVINAEWRKAKQQGKTDSGDDVEMQEAIEETGDGEASRISKESDSYENIRFDGLAHKKWDSMR